MVHEATIEVYTLSVQGSAADVVVLDDESRSIEAWRDLLGGEAATIVVPCKALLPEFRTDECVTAIVRWLKDSDTSRARMVVVDNCMPLENTGREIAARLKRDWVVIASNEKVSDEVVENPHYLGWVLKSRTSEFASRLRDILDGGFVSKHLVSGLADHETEPSLPERFTTLKHRLCNLFVPCLFDLRCVRDVWNQSGDEAQAWSCLQAGFDAKSEQQYYQSVLRAARIVAIPEWPQGSRSPRSGDTKRVAESLLSLVRESGCESSDAWRQVCALLGIERSGDGYAPSPDSPIATFWQRLDDVRDGGIAKAPAAHTLFDFGTSARGWGCEELPDIRTVDEWFGALEASMVALHTDIQRRDALTERLSRSREREE